MLSNVVYIGKARHKDRIYEGEHEAIVDDETFSAVGRLLKAQTPNRRTGAGTRSRHLLTGLLFDETGDRLSPIFTVKDKKRYRYYISNRLETRAGRDPSGWRLPADELERTILHQLDAMLRDEVRLSQWANMLAPAIPVQTAIAGATGVREVLGTSTEEQGRTLKRLVRSICVKPDAMVFEIGPHGLIDEARGNVGGQQSVMVSIPMTLRRRGCEARLVLEGHSPSRKPDDGLVKLLAKAHVMLKMLTDGSGRTVADLGNDIGIHVADVSRIVPLAFLAPRVTDAIVRGRQPVELTPRRLMRDELSLNWGDQLQQLGF